MRLNARHLAGLDDGFSRAFELVLTPVVFALMGFGLDRLFGTTPLFTICLAVFAVAGTAVKSWYDYDASMKRHEEDLAARRRGANDEADVA